MILMAKSMSLLHFNEIQQYIQTSGDTARECLAILKQKYPHIKHESLFSILSQDVQKDVKKNYHRYHSSSATANYYKRYTEMVSNDDQRPQGLILVDMAKNYGLPPALLARMVLEKYIAETQQEIANKTSGNLTVSKLMKDTSLIDNGRLSFEIEQCILEDICYGYYVETIKHSIGNEYEIKAQRHLDEISIPYIAEDEMRMKGYDKTPDVKLEVPIAVDGMVVNWIESKASFGDEDSHAAYLKDQFWSYWNRFGPGMVIYWFGYIEELDCHRDRGLILKDHFPTDVQLLKPML